MGLQQGQRQAGTHDLDGESREAGAAADVDGGLAQGAHLLQGDEEGQGLQEVAPLHGLRVCEGGEAQARPRRLHLLHVGAERLQLVRADTQS